MTTENATMHPDDAAEWRARTVPVFNDRALLPARSGA